MKPYLVLGPRKFSPMDSVPFQDGPYGTVSIAETSKRSLHLDTFYPSPSPIY